MFDYIREYAQIIQGLYKLGFKVISYDPNMGTMPTRKGFPLFEIVFRKTKVCMTGGGRGPGTLGEDTTQVKEQKP